MPFKYTPKDPPQHRRSAYRQALQFLLARGVCKSHSASLSRTCRLTGISARCACTASCELRAKRGNGLPSRILTHSHDISRFGAQDQGKGSSGGRRSLPRRCCGRLRVGLTQVRYTGTHGAYTGFASGIWGLKHSEFASSASIRDACHAMPCMYWRRCWIVK